MKKSRLKRRSKSKRAKLTKQLDALCRKAVEKLDDRCQWCGTQDGQWHTSHVYAKGVGASWRRFDLVNVKRLCATCHRRWHENPTDSGNWFVDTFPRRDAYLEKMYGHGLASKITDDSMENLIEVYRRFLNDEATGNWQFEEWLRIRKDQT